MNKYLTDAAAIMRALLILKRHRSPYLNQLPLSSASWPLKSSSLK